MPEEKDQLLETAREWKANSKVFEELSKKEKGHLRYGYHSIACTFMSNAKILEAYGKSENPNTDKYHEVFPQGQN